MNWVAKAVLQKGMSALPRSQSANYLFQRHVTRTLPLGDPKIRRKFDRALTHVHVFDEQVGRPRADAVFYEFGAGWDLAVQLAYTALGVGRQTLVDIRPNIQLPLVNETLASLARQHAELGDVRDLGGPVGSVAELKGRFGIEYHSPVDARATGFPAASVDFVSSTNTLEHIPAADMVAILRESARLLRPGGAMSFRVDMQDHSAYSDTNVSIYNYLRFTEKRWKLYSSALAYQNRLRLTDYRRLFAEAGLETVSEVVSWPSEDELAILGGIELAPQYEGYPPEELGAKHLAVVLRPASPDRAEEPGDVGGSSGARVHPGAGT